MSVENVIKNHPVVVEIFQSGPKLKLDQQNDIAVPRAMPSAWLKTGLRHYGMMFQNTNHIFL